MIGDTAIMRQLRNTVQKVAAADIDVLIEGETGVGKDTVAMLIHQWSNRGATSICEGELRLYQFRIGRKWVLWLVDRPRRLFSERTPRLAPKVR